MAGSAAIKHKPSGLFIMGIFSTSDSNATNVSGGFNGQDAPQMTAWNVQGGIQRRTSFLSLDRFGETVFWGGYSDVRDGFAPGSSGVATINGVPNSPCVVNTGCTPGNLGTAPNMELKPFTFPGIGITTQITGSDVNDWFLAFDQSFDAAALHL